MNTTTIPNNCIYDSTTESFVDATAFTDMAGNLVAPPGFSFVQAEVQIPVGVGPYQMAMPHMPMYNNPNVHPHFQDQQFAGYEDYTSPAPAHSGYGYPQRRRNFPFQHSNKETIVELTFNTIKAATTNQNVWVDFRTEDEGFYTLRVHLKKQQDISMSPMIIQKIISEIGVKEFSMHFLKRSNVSKKTGITIYMRMNQRESDVQKAIEEFRQYSIHARRVRTPQQVSEKENKTATPTSNKHKSSEKKSTANSKRSSLLLLMKKDKPRKVVKPSRTDNSEKKIVHVFSSGSNTPTRPGGHDDEDPDIEESEEEIFSSKSRSNSNRYTLKPAMMQKTSSRTISVLIPEDASEETLELKFKDGKRKKIRMRFTKTSKSIPKLTAERILRKKVSDMSKSNSS